jgi:type II secretory pathway component PulM
LNASEVRTAGYALPADTGEAPVVLVDRVGREAGLGGALRGTQPNATGVRVQLEAAPFDTVISWLDTLDTRYGFALESISLDRGAAPGMVNASVTFTQARH